MDQERMQTEQGRTPGPWELRLAGSQEDGNPALWAEHARDAGAWAALTGAFARQGGLALFVFVAVFVPAAVWVLLQAPPYEGSVRLLVKGAPGRDGSATATPLEVAQAIEELRRADALRRTAARLGLEELGQDLRVAAIPDSSVVSIRYVHEDAETAAGVAQAVADAFLERVAKAQREPLEILTARLSLLQRQAEELPSNVGPIGGAGYLRSRLRALERELEAQRTELLASGGAGAPLMDEVESRLGQTEQALAASNRPGMDLDAAVRALRDAIGADLERTQAETSARRAEGPAEAAFRPIAEALEPARAFPVEARPWPPLSIAALAAAVLAWAAVASADKRQRPVGYVAEIAMATEAPVLWLAEERQSNVS